MGMSCKQILGILENIDYGFLNLPYLHNFIILRGLPGSSAGKESAYKAGDLGLIPGLGRSPGEGNT